MNNYYGRQNETIYIIFSIFVKGGTYYQSINISTGNGRSYGKCYYRSCYKKTRVKMNSAICTIHFKPWYKQNDKLKTYEKEELNFSMALRAE